MQQLKLKQGSPEWHAHRRNYRNASDAPAMMGCSPYKTRDQLLHEVFTGLSEEVSESQQQRFDAGHRFEALCRTEAEKIIGERLYPVVGVEGRLSASFDGLTMAGKVNYEHKTLNKDLRAVMVGSATGADLPLMYRVQMEQQHMVSAAEKTLFMASKWVGDELQEARHVWYTPDPALAAQIEAGWAQFEIDLAAYVLPEASKPAATATAAPLELLPVNIKVEGNIALIDNLDAFEQQLTIYIERINLKPETDTDFANLDAAAKSLKKAEDALEAAKVHALGQTASIDKMVRTVDGLKEVCKTNRLMASKLYETEKAARKSLMVVQGKEAAAKHINDLNTSIGKPYMPLIPYDFAAVITGLKSVDNMKTAINNELARVKIEANTIADRIRANLVTLQDRASNHKLLFTADIATLVLKTPEDLDSTITARISEHDKQEKERQDRQRETIRQEEETKAGEKTRMAMSEIQGIQQQAVIAVLGRAGVRKGGTIECIRETLAETEAWVIDDRFGVLKGSAQEAKDKAVADIKELLEAAVLKAAEALPASVNPAPTADGAARQVKEVISQATAAAPTAAPAYAPLTASKATAGAPVAAPKPAGPPDLKLGEICARLGFTLTAAFLTELGYPPAAKAGSANLYHQADYPRICQSLIEHIQKARELQAA